MAFEERIVITGAGIVSAIGIGKEETLESLQALRSGIDEVRYLVTEHHELPVGEVKRSNEELDAITRVEKDGDKPLCRNTMIARLALREALDEAGMLTTEGVLTEELDGQMPFLSGTSVAGMDRGESLFTSTDIEDMNRTMLSASTDCGSHTCDVARAFGSFAMMDTLSTACSSAANAVQLGANMLKTGRCRRAVVGGTESLSRFHLNGFNTLMILDKQQCRPMDATRAGLNLGEGAAYLVIETLSSARERGAKILGVVDGYGNACDAYHQTASSADGEGAYLAMRKALKMARLQPSDIDYINAHGTGTPNNDPSELTALHRLFGDIALPPYSSTKGFTGHTTSASGSIEAVFCLLALAHQFLPVSLACAQPVEGEPAPVMAETTVPQREIRHILCNAFAFGGNDSSMVISSAKTLDETPVDEPIALPALPQKKVYVIAENTLCEGDADPEFKRYMTPGEARRLCPMLKRSLSISLQTLRDAAPEGEGAFVPDAIITGTAWGNIESSRSFLQDMMTDGEHLLKPTPFMQSTHNTIGSLIAINTHNHGYNNTHSQGDESLSMALLDAWMLIQLGEVKSALVGLHDMLPTRIDKAMLLVSEEVLPEGSTIIRTYEP